MPIMTVAEAAPKIHRMKVEELAAHLLAGTAPRLIDVREAYEWGYARIEGAELLPLSEIQAWWLELDPLQPLCFHCHHGVRSESVCRALAAEGFAAVYTLEGGIEAWSLRVDGTVPLY
jgi:rhodanese-related sulfurtransferase